MAGLLNELSLQVLNQGSTPTFDTIRGGKVLTSFVDVTACKHSIPVIKQNNRLNSPWWSEELAKLKCGVVTRKRRIRCAAPSRRRDVVDEYLKAKAHYEEEVKKAKTASWKEFCGKQDREGLWEGIYRDGAEGDNFDHRETREKAERLAREVVGVDDPLFTALELKQAAVKFNPKKAPGSDGLTADICAQAILHKPGFCLSLVNQCLKLGYFPAVWKEATVVVLRKPGKDDYSQPKSYRPIGLLPVMGKILERLIVNRLTWHLVPRLSTR
ncbi:hypothetical protein K1T71_015098 [Dendrolimus kikuchii]|nr:hypothetical protein K1T71_015098 [Dendrolimus kikuchii]